MSEKKAILLQPALHHHQGSWLLHALKLRLAALTTFVFLGMLVFWSIDRNSVTSIVNAWQAKQVFGSVKALTSSDVFIVRPNETPMYTPSTSPMIQMNADPVSFNTSSSSDNQTQLVPVALDKAAVDQTKNVLVPAYDSPVNRSSGETSWISAQLAPNFTVALHEHWLAPGGEPCQDSKTEQITFPGLDGRDLIELSAGEVNEFPFTALDSAGNPRCRGGDYFEMDLSGESWKSRPLVKDFGNGSYTMSLQVHPDFLGEYNLTVILLFRHFEGLKFSPPRFVVDRQLRSFHIRFHRSKAMLPDLQYCESTDFNRDVWVGRWTRHGRNDDCKISNDGRYRCLPPDFPCREPWCNGSLGVLESNGWVYSAHCSFRIFPSDHAWNCLKNRWIFFWGDSNHVDTIRNILNFILGHPEIPAVPRRFDLNFTNPRDPSQSLRITSIYNGHSNVTKNYEGLDSLSHEDYLDLLRKYFSDKTAPDTIIMNSGLHDGIHWRNIRGFTNAAKYAASFWKDVVESVKGRGLKPPDIFYRTTVATGGYARSMGFNPSKMETFNGIAVDQLRQAGLLSGVIDNFDMTFPWHYDNRCNDGVHYGRAPEYRKWRDGEIGHQYFVDLMLAHVLLNVLCTR